MFIIPIFKYVAKDVEGSIYRTTIYAKSKEDFLYILKKNNLYCLEYSEIKRRSNFMYTSIDTRNLAIFCRQFATMLDSGISVIKCLDILYKQANSKKMKSIYLNLYENIQQGNALSTSLKHQGHIFPKLFISMVESGEISGTLDNVLLQMATHYENEYKLNNKIKNALAYPLVLGVISIGVIIILLSVVIPTFAQLFEGVGEIPNSTQTLLAISSFITTHGLSIVLVGITTLIGLIVLYLKTPFKSIIDQLKLKLPLIGPMNTTLLSARFAKILSSMYTQGISLVEALEMADRVLNNAYLTPKIKSVKSSVSRGYPLSESIVDIKIFPVLLTDMILMGEESGKLGEILEKIALFYQEEVNGSTQKIVILLEPIIIIILGGIIGWIILSILPPMYQMMQNI